MHRTFQIKKTPTLVWAIAAKVVAYDFISKGLVRMGIIKTQVRLNDGLAFGIPAGFTISTIITVGVLGALMFLYKRYKDDLSSVQLLAFGLIFGGSFSNLLERIYSGHITDFIKLGNAYLNIADISIFAGISLLLVSLLYEPKTT